MSEAGNPVKLIPHYPPPMLIPKHLASNIACITPRRVENFDNEQSEISEKEVMSLRCDNLRLTEELERARMHPMNDPSYDRVNVDHQLWMRQQTELRCLQDYKTRYYVSVFILLLIVIRFCLHFIVHI